MRLLLMLSVFTIAFVPVWAQNDTLINLIPNGNFEAGNIGFRSDFLYTNEGLSRGYYAITRYASRLGEDYQDPVDGDHTSGYGYYMVIDADDEKGQKTWCSTLKVEANTVYTFSVWFCNLYVKRANKSSFAFNGVAKGNDPRIRLSINGKQAGKTEADIFHRYDWIKASCTWYSGPLAKTIDICIENLNFSGSGNDLAIDDIGFYYVKTMPKGYKPPVFETIMIEPEDKPAPDTRIRMVHGKGNGYNQFPLGDSIAPGIYGLHPSYKPEPVVIKDPSDTIVAGKEIQLAHAIFLQGKSELTGETKAELDLLAVWLKNHPHTTIRLEGHTDNQGDYYLNISLSEDRVRNVKKYLIAKGIDPDRISFVGYGGTHPLYSNADEETRKLNRRVVFVIGEE